MLQWDWRNVLVKIPTALSVRGHQKQLLLSDVAVAQFNERFASLEENLATCQQQLAISDLFIQQEVESLH